MPGILEINAVEYYANETEDDIEKGIVGGLIVAPVEPDKNLRSSIKGEGFIKPKVAYTFTYEGNENDVWSIDNSAKLPIEVSVNGKAITVKWLKTFSGQFVLRYGRSEKTVVVESLF